jgi:hypothetical protein
MGERLEVFGRSRYDDYYLAWLIDGEEGADIRHPPIDDEHKAIIEAAEPFAVKRPGERLLVFETYTAATKALRAARAAIKSHKAAKPWPEWAITASAHGWKPPKGWAP